MEISGFLEYKDVLVVAWWHAPIWVGIQSGDTHLAVLLGSTPSSSYKYWRAKHVLWSKQVERRSMQSLVTYLICSLLQIFRSATECPSALQMRGHFQHAS
ncbi:hypothetical protein A0H81_02375 [Grifola frondosa]|uniref:Uncharacterized protein n=1 Tax=Grifola frondosa TaxID=5627 RepID=A0A1C7MKU7_GRIFR|nr:hypothetical protein A0H81_02375 [Grifola frondosa]